MDGEERAWLDEELTKSEHEEGVLYRIAVLHHSPYSAGPHGPNKRLQNARIPELLVRHRVDLVVGGHDHHYERGETAGLRYMISGGGGAPLYREIQPTAGTRKAEATHHYVAFHVRPAGITIDAVRADGSLLDRCGFDRGAAGWSCEPGAPAAVASEPAPPAPAPRPASKCTCRAAGAPASPCAGLFASLALAAAATARRARGSLRRGRSTDTLAPR
jgi:hypothetical protein